MLRISLHNDDFYHRSHSHGKICAISQSDLKCSLDGCDMIKPNADIFPRETINSQSMHDDNVLIDYLLMTELIKKLINEKFFPRTCVTQLSFKATSYP